MAALYAKTAEVSVAGGAGQTRLLSPANSFTGQASIPANPAVGSVFILQAWGKYRSTDVNGLSVQLRFYLNSGTPPAALTPAILDTGTINYLLPNGTFEWRFDAMFTVRTNGASGTYYIDGVLLAARNQAIGNQSLWVQLLILQIRQKHGVFAIVRQT